MPSDFWLFCPLIICFLRIKKIGFLLTQEREGSHLFCFGFVCFALGKFETFSKFFGERDPKRILNGAFSLLFPPLSFRGFYSSWPPHAPLTLPPFLFRATAPSLTSALNNKAVYMCGEKLKNKTDGSFITRLFGLIELEMLFFFFSRRLSWTLCMTSHELQ